MGHRLFVEGTVETLKYHVQATDELDRPERHATIKECLETADARR
jgi:hypothetical protein